MASPGPLDGPVLDALRAVDGRQPGRRGQATRQRLLDELLALLDERTYRELKVTDVSRAAGTSAATFYQYFPDLETALLMIGEQVVERGVALRQLIAGRPWQGQAGYETAQGIVDGLLDFWQSEAPVLRVVDLLTEEGDPRFRAIRHRILNAVTLALSAAVAQAQGAGRIPDDVHPHAVGSTLVSMLAHVAAHQRGLGAWGVPREDLRRTMTRIVHWTVTGESGYSTPAR